MTKSKIEPPQVVLREIWLGGVAGDIAGLRRSQLAVTWFLEVPMPETK